MRNNKMQGMMALSLSFVLRWDYSPQGLWLSLSNPGTIARRGHADRVAEEVHNNADPQEYYETLIKEQVLTREDLDLLLQA